jgi:hypothetical protein
MHRTDARARSRSGADDQANLLHHGYEGRLSTGGNLAFPFTPPEVSIGPAYRFNIYHLMRTADLVGLFPLEIETL